MKLNLQAGQSTSTYLHELLKIGKRNILDMLAETMLDFYQH